MDGMAFVQVVFLNCLVLLHLDLGSLVLFLGVVKSVAVLRVQETCSATHIGPIWTLIEVCVTSVEASSVLKYVLKTGSPSSHALTLST